MNGMVMIGLNTTAQNIIRLPQTQDFSVLCVLSDMTGDASKARRVCPACGGKQSVLTDVHEKQKHAQNQPRTLYLRCEKCAQIQVVEE